MFLSRSYSMISMKLSVRCCSSLVGKTSTTEEITIYGDVISPPVRFVLMTASVLEIALNFQEIDLFKGENRTEEYMKINPLCKVPTMLVNGETICDSHAIAVYLCQSDNGSKLYPKDGWLQAKINQMLFYNSSTLFPIDSAIYTDFFAGKWPVDKENISKWNAALDYLEYRLNKHGGLADDQMWLCDICCAATVSSLKILVPLTKRHVLVKLWLEKMENRSCFHHINQRGVARLQELVDKMKKKMPNCREQNV